jgi:hypothetical protein
MLNIHIGQTGIDVGITCGDVDITNYFRAIRVESVAGEATTVYLEAVALPLPIEVKDILGEHITIGVQPHDVTPFGAKNRHYGVPKYNEQGAVSVSVAPDPAPRDDS